MIIAVAIAEKEERLRRETLHSAITGYDLMKWTDADIQIRDKLRHLQQCNKINIPPPIKETHRFSHCQCTYTEIHQFLSTLHVVRH